MAGDDFRLKCKDGVSLANIECSWLVGDKDNFLVFFSPLCGADELESKR